MTHMTHMTHFTYLSYEARYTIKYKNPVMSVIPVIDRPEIPFAKAYISRTNHNYLAVKCPYCSEFHYHHRPIKEGETRLPSCHARKEYRIHLMHEFSRWPV